MGLAKQQINSEGELTEPWKSLNLGVKGAKNERDKVIQNLQTILRIRVKPVLSGHPLLSGQ